MVPLLFTGDNPLPGYEDIPTAGSLGFSDLPSMPRGLILPPDAPEEAQEFWIDTMKQVVETEEWQAYLEENYLTEDVRWGEDFETFLSETQEQFETILKEQGAL
jgi:putative tricarboxylic transport membrane protein